MLGLKDSEPSVAHSVKVVIEPCARLPRTRLATERQGYLVGSRAMSRRIVLVSLAVGVLVATASLTLGYVVGVIAGERGAYHRQFTEERDALAPKLVTDPAFAAVVIEEYSNGGAYLTGEVETEADFLHLSALVRSTLGESRGQRALYGVWVRDRSTNRPGESDTR